ncbi:hypothetical protein [Fortiea contorta]|uniref:hypothetical protein n=1 Tax=Fortiea contorta TaxID=1892405 RepID=UPI0003456ADA|nr:hypothetical protein [Fortiea contorta]
MNPESEQELQRRLKQLEAEIKSSSTEDPRLQTLLGSLEAQIRRSLDWVKSLSTTKRLAVFGIAALVGIFLLQTVLKLVASVISMALLAVLVYLGYKFFVSSSQENKK